MLLGYARVWKAEDQDPAAQVSALKAAGCTRVYEEKASGGRWDRPELHRLLDHLREGDMVVVWKLDRLSRSLKDVLHIMECIGNAGAGFRSITGYPKKEKAQLHWTLTAHTKHPLPVRWSEAIIPKNGHVFVECLF